MEQKHPLIPKLFLIGLAAVAAVYGFVLVKIVLLKYGLHAGLRSFNFLPFQFVTDLMKQDVSLDVSLKNILGNIAIFIPLGILVPALVPKADQWKKVVLTGFLISLAFELSQAIFGLGATDVDDLLLNTLGAAIGAAMYFFLFARVKGFPGARGASFLFLALFGLFGLAALWLYAPGELPQVRETVNMEALGGLDPQTYTVTVNPSKFENDLFSCDPSASALNENVTDASLLKESYPLAADAKFYHMVISCQYSPNGNVQKVISTYSALTGAEAEKLILTEAHCFADLWLDADGAVTAALITTYLD